MSEVTRMSTNGKITMRDKQTCIYVSARNQVAAGRVRLVFVDSRVVVIFRQSNRIVFPEPVRDPGIFPVKGPEFAQPLNSIRCWWRYPLAASLLFLLE